MKRFDFINTFGLPFVDMSNRSGHVAELTYFEGNLYVIIDYYITFLVAKNKLLDIDGQKYLYVYSDTSKSNIILYKVYNSYTILRNVNAFLRTYASKDNV